MMSETPTILVEDKLICENCVKADVCEILRSVIRLDVAAKNIQKDYNVTLELSAAIVDCENKLIENIEVKT